MQKKCFFEDVLFKQILWYDMLFYGMSFLTVKRANRANIFKKYTPQVENKCIKLEAELWFNFLYSCMLSYGMK